MVNSKRHTFKKCCKQLVVNTKSFFSDNKTKYNIKNINFTSAKCLNISKRSVARISHEVKLHKKVREPKYRGNSGRKKIVIDEFFQSMVRMKMLEVYKQKKTISIQDLLTNLTTEVDDFPVISPFRFKKYLKRFKF